MYNLQSVLVAPWLIRRIDMNDGTSRADKQQTATGFISNGGPSVHYCIEAMCYHFRLTLGV